MTHHLEYGKSYDIVADTFSVNAFDISPTILDLSLTNAVGSARTEVGEAAKVHFKKEGTFVTMTLTPSGLNTQLNANNTALMTFNEIVPVGFRPVGPVGGPISPIINRVNAVNGALCYLIINLPGNTIQITSTAGVNFVSGQNCAVLSSSTLSYNTV